MEENKVVKKKTFVAILIIIIGLAMIGVGSYIAYVYFSQIQYFLGIVGLVLAILGLAVVCWLISNYNKLVMMKHKVNESLSLIDVQLKQRFDLIPNLVNTVKGYAKHEKEVLTEITEIRNQALKAQDEKEKIDLGNKSLSKIKQIVAIAEDYPELKANALFRSLMEELVLIEDKIVAARRFYDSNVNMYNTAIEVWPSNIVAKIYGHSRLELYRIDAGERLNVNLDTAFKE